MLLPPLCPSAPPFPSILALLSDTNSVIALASGGGLVSAWIDVHAQYKLVRELLQLFPSLLKWRCARERMPVQAHSTWGSHHAVRARDHHRPRCCNGQHWKDYRESIKETKHVNSKKKRKQTMTWPRKFTPQEPRCWSRLENRFLLKTRKEISTYSVHHSYETITH